MVGGNFLAGAAGGAVVSIVIKAVDDFSKTIDDATAKTKDMGKKLSAIGAGVSAAGIAGAVGIAKLAEEAGKGVGIANAFNEFFGKQAPANLEVLRKATRGTVDDIQLMRQANQAMLLGIDPDALPAMFEGAFAAASATGRPVSDAITDITTGIGRQSKLILDNLGIIVNAEQANAKYAESMGITDRALTDEEKKIAFTNATMEALNANAERIGPIQDTAALAIQRATAQWDNAKQILGEAFAPAVEKVSQLITGLIERFNQLSPRTQQFIGFALVAITVLTIIIGVLIMVSGAIMLVNASLLPWIAGILILIAIIGLIIAAIFYWKDILVWFSKVQGKATQFIMDTWDGFLDFWKILWAQAKNVFIQIWNWIVGYYESQINTIIKGLNLLISGINKIPGINIPLIPKVDLGMLKGQLTNVESLKAELEAERYLKSKTRADEINQGINIKIDNIYGTDPKEMSEALFSELKLKTNI